jgi:MinD-like ATPase involved in chromosome partitioning or flagellar assembly
VIILAADENPKGEDAAKEKLRREILQELNVSEGLFTSDAELMRSLEDALTVIANLKAEIALAKKAIVDNLRNYEASTRNRDRIIKEQEERF